MKTSAKFRANPDPEGLFHPAFQLETYGEAALLSLLKNAAHIQNIFYHEVSFRPHKLVQKTFTNVWFKRTVIEDARFLDCKFVDCRFMGMVFRNCEFHDCIFEHCNTYKIRFEKTYINPKSFVDLPDKKNYANIGVHLFQELFRNSHETLQTDFKNSAEYDLKKWKRYELVSKWRKKNKANTWAFFKKWLPNMIFFLLSGYGLKAVRLVVWSLILFAAIVMFNYYHWTCFNFQSPNLSVDSPTLHLAAYYTTVTLSTLGYGDITPRSNFGLLAAAGEAILGLVWLAGVASVFIKKVLR